jgi:hypothetical protein
MKLNNCDHPEVGRRKGTMQNVMPDITLYKRELCLFMTVPISFALDSARASLRYQFVIDSLDVWLPASNLGLVHLNDGVLGFTGYVFCHVILPQASGPADVNI